MVKRFFVVVMVALIGFIFVSSSSFGEIEDELAFIVKNNPVNTKIEKKAIDFTFKEVSEAKLAFMGLIRLYQLFISSQDKPACSFTFNCSRFGMLAIRKYGIFFGALMTSDRLQRCNGLGRKYYPIDSETGLAVDYHIDAYYLGKTKKITNKP